VRYVDEAVSFISYNTKAEKPWFVYYAFNHVHTPDFASQDFCNKTKRGRFGDALMVRKHAFVEPFSC
jgi:arylsulfatase A